MHNLLSRQCRCHLPAQKLRFPTLEPLIISYLSDITSPLSNLSLLVLLSLQIEALSMPLVRVMSRLISPIILKDVFYSPEISFTLISVSHLLKDNKSILFKDDYCFIKEKGGKVIGQIPEATSGLQWLKKLSQCLATLERLACHK
jgi:hypothetical protein